MIVGIALTAVALATTAAASPPPAGAKITGVVLDSAGLPLAGVCMGEMHSDDGAFDVFRAPFPDRKNCTGEDGAFTLRVTPGHVSVVAARYDEKITLRLTPVRVGASGARVVVRFDGAASLRIRAVDEAGRPLGKVRVTALPERTGPAAARGDATVVRGWTAEDGTLELSGLAQGEHRLIAYGAGHRCQEPCEYGRGMRVRTGVHQVNVPMSRLGSISGRVLYRDPAGELQPLPAFAVQSPALGSFVVRTEEGRFELEVMRLWSGAPLFVTVPGLAPFATKFDLKEPVLLDLGDIVLGPGRSVRGRVTDASGKPVEGAQVQVGFANDVLPKPLAETGATGAFQIDGVSHGATTLAVTHAAFRPQEVAVAAGADDLDVRLASGVRLTVRVVDVDGKALPGAWVWNVTTMAGCETGEDGACTLTGLERKEQVLEASVPGAPRPQAYQVRVPIGSATTPPVSVRLPRQPSVLRIVPTETDGTFVQATVQIVPGDVGPERAVDEKGKLAVPYHATGIDLEKRITNLPPGRYTAFVRSFSNPARCTVRVVELAEGADQRVVVKLPAERGPCRP